MPQPRRTGRMRTRRGGSVSRRIWPLATVLAVVVWLTACSADHATSTGTDSAAPAGGAAPMSAASVRTVPMTVKRSGTAALELVPVSIDGHGPYMFMLDTGSSISSVSKSLARTLKLPSTGSSVQVKGVVTSQQVKIVSIRAWRVGDVALAPDHVAVLESSSPGQVAGLLGSDELSRFSAVTEDFQHHELRLTGRSR